MLVASGANFLVLDEPTNHLDLESREALEEALEAFPGTVLLVSHDRALLDAIAERTAAIEDGTVRLYDGGWADYVRRRDELAATAPCRGRDCGRACGAEAAEGEADGASRAAAPATRWPRSRRASSRRKRVVAKLEAKLAEDWGDVDTIAAHRRAREDLQALIGEWEQLVDEVAR